MPLPAALDQKTALEPPAVKAPAVRKKLWMQNLKKLIKARTKNLSNRSMHIGIHYSTFGQR
ncbi:MAG TPA: hypothetical protein DD706_17735 [Nitrospiraceae bacterium]|nr:hypothetical protein [Nitrospiraceae bacterium]